MADDGAKKNENETPNMENIFEAMSEVFEIAENDILLTMNEELYKGFNLDNWKIYQLSRKRYLKEKSNRELEGVQDKQIQQIHNAASLMNAKNVKFTRDLINKTEEAKYLESQYDMSALPEVVATKQQGVDTSKEGLTLNKTEINAITDDYKGTIEVSSKEHHELRREIEQRIDPYEEDPELDIYEEDAEEVPAVPFGSSPFLNR